MRALTMTLLFLAVASGAVKQTNWKTFAAPDGSFSVLFPNNPTENKQTVNTAAGPINTTMYVSADDNATKRIQENAERIESFLNSFKLAEARKA
jgi:hypothetical protein